MTEQKKTVKAAFVTREELVRVLEQPTSVSAALTARMAAEIFRLRAKLKVVKSLFAARVLVEEEQPILFRGARSAEDDQTFYKREHAAGQAVLDAAGVSCGREGLAPRIAHVVERMKAAEKARNEAESSPRSDANQQAREFRAAMGQSVGKHPHVPHDEIVRFCVRLVAEEFFEMLEATFGTTHEVLDAHSAAMRVIDEAPIRVDLPELADACGDLDYVVAGLRAAFGIDGGPIADLIHTANMAKANGPIRESDGKRLKPEGWTPPDVAGELQRQGWVEQPAAGPNPAHEHRVSNSPADTGQG